MPKISVISVGVTKEDYFKAALIEYAKRISSMANLSFESVPEQKLSQNPSESSIKIALDKEADGIISKIPKGAYVISMCIEGKRLSSEGFAELISNVQNLGKSSITFIIGGSFGLSDKIKNMSDFRLSMSDMTFPHAMARVFLVEQIYRALSINQNGKYHK